MKGGRYLHCVWRGFSPLVAVGIPMPWSDMMIPLYAIHLIDGGTWHVAIDHSPDNMEVTVHYLWSWRKRSNTALPIESAQSILYIYFLPVCVGEVGISGMGGSIMNTSL